MNIDEDLDAIVAKEAKEIVLSEETVKWMLKEYLVLMSEEKADEEDESAYESSKSYRLGFEFALGMAGILDLTTPELKH